MTRIIALSGYAQSGKSTVAEYLADQHGYIPIAFADVLRDCVAALNPMIAYKGDYFRTQDLLKWHGYEKVKEHAPLYREYLQRMGTEVGRNILGEDIWVESTFLQMDPDLKYVISDARFLNEATTVQAEGGLVWRIYRDGVNPINQHPSETSLDDFRFDDYLFNNSSLDDLFRDVDEILSAAQHRAENYVI